MLSEALDFLILAHVFRGLGFLDLSSRFQTTKGFLGFGSCFQRTKVSGSWLIFLEAYDFGAWLMISEVQGCRIMTQVFSGFGFLDLGSCFQRTKDFLGLGSCLQRTKGSRSWLIFSKIRDFLDLGTCFKRTKGFLGFDSCFQRTKGSRSWLMFSEA